MVLACIGGRYCRNCKSVRVFASVDSLHYICCSCSQCLRCGESFERIVSYGRESDKKEVFGCVRPESI